jgi:uncharacterized paraquat-inducible protein A
MSQPVAPIPLGFPENTLIFCQSCSVHYAHASQPLCPVCLDQRKRERRGES